MRDPAPEIDEEAARVATLESFAVLDTAPEPVFDDLVRLASLVMAAPFVAVNLIDDHRTWAKATVGAPQGYEVPLSEEPFCARSMKRPTQVTVIEDTLTDPQHLDNVMTRRGLRFYAGAPLVTRKGHAVGTLCVSDLVPRTPTAEQVAGLAALAAAATAHLELRLRVTEAEAASASLATLAWRDGLTGLANRRAFDSALAAAVRDASATGDPVGLVMIDLDRFKTYNDTHGHVAGDDLLRRCAQSWRSVVEHGDVLARYGGEEFAVISTGRDVASCVALAEGLRKAMPAPQTCSAGVAVFRPGETANQLIRRADHLLYDAKQAGRDMVRQR